MKKSNIITLLSFVGMILAVILFMLFWKSSSRSSENDMISATSESSDANLSESEISEENNSTTESTPAETQPDTAEPATVSMYDALFIGDSRTVGLMEYAQIEGADFFCTIGMSVYNIHNKPVSVPNVGKVTLTELLDGKNYGKIYIMLGINEVGYKLDSIVTKYNELIDFIKEKQPNAVIFIQANLHVTKSRSDTDRIVNNDAINKLNAELSKLADGRSKFYIDANILFDDDNGGLSSDKSEDSTHLYAKYYSEWGEWIIRQTASLIGEG